MTDRILLTAVCTATALTFSASAAMAGEGGTQCIAPLTYLPLDGNAVGFDAQGVPALGTYERISPDGRFILRSYSGAKVGTVSLMELPASGDGLIRVYSTPFSNEAFPVQGTWRYLVDVNGDHYRFTDVLRPPSCHAPRPILAAFRTSRRYTSDPLAGRRTLTPTAKALAPCRPRPSKCKTMAAARASSARRALASFAAIDVRKMAECSRCR